MEFNFEPISNTLNDDLVATPKPEDKAILLSRPPVVTIIGYVNYRKTTILN